MLSNTDHVIQIQYSDSLRDARKEIDDGARRKAEIDVRVARLRDDLAEIRNRFVKKFIF